MYAHFLELVFMETWKNLKYIPLFKLKRARQFVKTDSQQNTVFNDRNECNEMGIRVQFV